MYYGYALFKACAVSLRLSPRAAIEPSLRRRRRHHRNKDGSCHFRSLLLLTLVITAGRLRCRLAFLVALLVFILLLVLLALFLGLLFLLLLLFLGSALWRHALHELLKPLLLLPIDQVPLEEVRDELLRLCLWVCGHVVHVAVGFVGLCPSGILLEALAEELAQRHLILEVQVGEEPSDSLPVEFIGVRRCLNSLGHQGLWICHLLWSGLIDAERHVRCWRNRRHQCCTCRDLG
mmetsp:Transcript_31611/g.73734  ORF Transcript_31611/g.73734 Transcript_31611/m.73734 type:complete len:234 (+) Transcript_31611:18-719(+)